jgi:hypothetical protein
MNNQYLFSVNSGLKPVNQEYKTLLCPVLSLILCFKLIYHVGNITTRYKN